MAEYIDRDKALKEFDAWVESTGALPKGTSYYAEARGCIECVPAADVEPVVRCKDCSHCYHGELCLACLFWHRMTNPNFYCQYGQKMDGEV